MLSAIAKMPRIDELRTVSSAVSVLHYEFHQMAFHLYLQISQYQQQR